MKEMTYHRIGETAVWQTLPNGLPVCVIRKRGYTRKYAFFATRYGGMDLRFQLDGQWLDTPAGIAHYLEHKMFDTEDGNALQELAKNGAEPNAFTSNAITCYYFDSTEKFYENLEILLSFVSVPYFTDESVEKEQGIIAQEINMIEDNPEWQVYKRLMQALYHTSPARTSVAGSVESIRQITTQTLYDCHRAFYTPANMCLVVVGDVDADKVLAAAERILPKTSGPDIPRDHGPAEDLTAAQPETACAMEVAMPTFLLGFKCPPVPEGPDRMRLDILGDLACDVLMGESSPLYARLYSQGLINGTFDSAYDLLPGAAYVFCGGDSLSIELKKKVDEFLKAHNASVQIRQGYGLTECVTASCLTPKDYNRVGSIGVPFPDTYYKIVKPGTTDEVDPNVEGEICISGPSVMLCYMNNESETANTLRRHADGRIWMHSGDLGKMDEDGFVYFSQRIKRMIITSGYNVYPGQLENIIDGHEKVLLSCVIGVKDPYKIQKVKAFVVLRPNYEPSDAIKQELFDYCRGQIAKYAMPYDIEFRTELPKTLVGKVAYRVLEEEEAERQAAQDAAQE